MQATPSRLPRKLDEYEAQPSPPKPKLLDQVRHDIRARHYSKRTESIYADLDQAIHYVSQQASSARDG